MNVSVLIESHLPWQKPNSTEFYAAKVMATSYPSLQQAYTAFPWATWIDYCRNGYALEPPPIKPLVTGIQATVCQHIWALEHLSIFKRAGITDLFWSHATKELKQIDGIRIHPFPLYPVRCATHPPTRPRLTPAKRPLLYSFKGAYSPGLYRTAVRDWLFEMPTRPDAQIERRREWHYEQAVYREQVKGHSFDSARHAQLELEADDYAETLQSSCFALCPSGSGPNSIRLWESLGYGAIPVILSDQLDLPGWTELWKASSILVSESKSAVAALPAQLEALATDVLRLEEMQQNGQKVWDRYGLDGFVSDIIEFLVEPLAVLRVRAKKNLTSEFIEIKAKSPATLPRELYRCLIEAPSHCSVLIVIIDQENSELLHVRWKSAIKICAGLIGMRPWAVASTSPALEAMAQRLK